MRRVRLAEELGMELACDNERVIFEFNNLDQFAIGRRAAEDETGFFVLSAVGVVEFIAVPVALVDQEGAVKVGGFGADGQLARLGPEAHSAAFVNDIFLLVEEGDNWMRRVG